MTPSSTTATDPSAAQPAVEVAWPSIRRLLAANHREATSVLFRAHPPGTPATRRTKAPLPVEAMGDALRVTQQAMQAANAAVPYDTVEATTVSPSPHGPVILLDRIDADPLVQRWLSVLADTMTSAGWSGRLAPAPTPRWPPVLDERQRCAHLTAYLAYTINRPAQRVRAGMSDAEIAAAAPRWNLDPNTAALVAADMSSWAHIPDADVVHLWQGSSVVEVTGPVPPEVLTATGRHAHAGRITTIRTDPPLIRQVSLSVYGGVVYQIDSDDGWPDRHAGLVDVISRHPDRLDLAVIRLNPMWDSSWNSVDTHHPAPAQIRSGRWNQARPWWDHRVPDAYRVQVLTDAHLARARTLDDWDIRPLGNGRHLVQHPDPAAWFSGTEPDPDTLTTARQDFGDMVLNNDTVRAAMLAGEL